MDENPGAFTLDGRIKQKNASLQDMPEIENHGFYNISNVFGNDRYSICRNLGKWFR